jgi:hypothetical protein
MSVRFSKFFTVIQCWLQFGCIVSTVKWPIVVIKIVEIQVLMLTGRNVIGAPHARIFCQNERHSMAVQAAPAPAGDSLCVTVFANARLSNNA